MRFDEDRDSGRISARRLNQAVESVQHILVRGWKGDLRCMRGWVVTIDWGIYNGPCEFDQRSINFFAHDGWHRGMA